jgi:hypothetical protein
VNKMNAAVNNGKDDPPFEVLMRGMVQQYGFWRVLRAVLRQRMPVPRDVPLALNPYLRRDIGLPPDDEPWAGL